MARSRLTPAIRTLVLTGTLLSTSFASLISPAPLGSANLTSVKDTLTSTSFLASRLSWAARVEADGTDESSSRVQIQAAPAAPYLSDTTNNLRAGDSLTINANTYTVVDIIDADEFTVSPVVQTGDADDGDPIQLRIKPRHVVTLNTATAVSNGFFQVLIPADPSTSYDNNIDDAGFDFGADTLNNISVSATDVDDPAGGAVEFDFVTGVSTRSGGVNCTSPANYHCFEVHYSGTGAINKTITINIGGLDGTNSLVSPGEASGHAEGTADSYSFIVKNFSAGSNPNSATAVDQTSGKIALIEAVRVTATVDPTINFTIAGVASGATNCGAGATADVTTTALAVPFGSLSLLDSFYDAEQSLSVSTNADGGYTVTAIENDELSLGGAGVTIIPDTDCDAGGCDFNTEAEWVTGSDNGFGYSLQDNGAASIAFEWDDSAGFAARPFSTLGTDSPEVLFQSSDPASSEGAYVCYRLSVGATQAAGEYENQINYTATGTF